MSGEVLVKMCSSRGVCVFECSPTHVLRDIVYMVCVDVWGSYVTQGFHNTRQYYTSLANVFYMYTGMHIL